MENMCDWIPLGDGQWKCSRCQKTRSWNGPELPPKRNCPNLTSQSSIENASVILPPPPPSYLRRARNFAKAIFMQAALGAESLLSDEEIKLTRSKQEIDEIGKICRACPLFNGKHCTHRDCGCTIDEERSAYWSKIAWKSQHCPDKPPRW